MTRAELAFGALDRNKKGYITAKDHWKTGKSRQKDKMIATTYFNTKI